MCLAPTNTAQRPQHAHMHMASTPAGAHLAGTEASARFAPLRRRPGAIGRAGQLARLAAGGRLVRSVDEHARCRALSRSARAFATLVLGREPLRGRAFVRRRRRSRPLNRRGGCGAARSCCLAEGRRHRAMALIDKHLSGRRPRRGAVPLPPSRCRRALCGRRPRSVSATLSALRGGS